jgi:hypothetical protein
MSDNPTAPRMLRGAIIGLDPMNPLASIVMFQYNPDTMTRRVDARTGGGGDEADRTEALRLSGPPKETITIAVEVDSADQPGIERPLVGVHPPLAALEMLLYPKSVLVIANTVLAALGNIEIVPPEAPMTLFVWGPARVLPVRITSLNITEEQFDTALNPTRAKVDITMGVLSYYDLKLTNPGYALFVAHQIAKEVMATSNVIGSVATLGASLKI